MLISLVSGGGQTSQTSNLLPPAVSPRPRPSRRPLNRSRTDRGQGGCGWTIPPGHPVTVLSPPQLFTVMRTLVTNRCGACERRAGRTCGAGRSKHLILHLCYRHYLGSDHRAGFVQIEYTLTVNQVGGFGTGVLSIVPNQATYHVGDVVTISASPGVGEKFINWSGNGVDIGGSPPDRQVTFDGSGNKTVTATFDFIEYTLTVTSAGGTGGATDRVTVSPPGTYHYGDVVALTANPQVGETFANWTGDLAEAPTRRRSPSMPTRR